EPVHVRRNAILCHHRLERVEVLALECIPGLPFSGLEFLLERSVALRGGRGRRRLRSLGLGPGRVSEQGASQQQHGKRANGEQRLLHVRVSFPGVLRLKDAAEFRFHRPTKPHESYTVPTIFPRPTLEAPMRTRRGWVRPPTGRRALRATSTSHVRSHSRNDPRARDLRTP